MVTPTDISLWRLDRTPRVARRTVLAALAGGAELVLAAGGGPARPALRIGAQGDTPSLLGRIAEQVVSEACRRAGIELTVRRLPPLRAIESANNGDVDGDMARIADVAVRYTNLVPVPTPLARVDVVVYRRSDDTRDFSRSAAGGLLLALTRGAFVLHKHAQGLRAMEVGRIDQAFHLLATGGADGALATYLDAEEALRRQRLPGIERWPAPWASEPVFLMLNRRHAALIPHIDAALQSMSREGLIERTYREAVASAGIEPLPMEAAARPGR